MTVDVKNKDQKILTLRQNVKSVILLLNLSSLTGIKTKNLLIANHSQKKSI